MNIILLGAPGSGKGTQAKKLLEKKTFIHLSTGDLLRTAIAEKTETGKIAASLISQGKFVDDEVVLSLVKDELTAKGLENNFIFDGFPRNLNQAGLLDDLLADLGISVNKVINVDIAEDSVIRRITGRLTCTQCGESYHKIYKKPQQTGICNNDGADLITREDDTEDVVKRRYATYLELTEPLIEYYNKKDLVCTINGSKEIDQIFAEICEKLEI